MTLTLERIREIENNQLTAQELTVLRLGLTGAKPAAIGKAIGVTRQRVEAVQTSTEKKLKAQGVK